MSNCSSVGCPSIGDINMPFANVDNSSSQAAPSTGGPLNNLGGIVNGLLGGGGLPLISDLVDINLTAPVGSTINSQQSAGSAPAAAPAAPAPEAAPAPMPQASVAPAVHTAEGPARPAINNAAGIVNAGCGGRGGGALISDVVDINATVPVGTTVNNTQSA